CAISYYGYFDYW
nr:immunoglobulin heavy chain junction region [Mus musculus]MBK4189301.1 immunoglobulin heavy chain junction region [Mus musculus]MBK4189302.1 immunoglobulin heavy chain junction region [Mus musculus]MBK4189303.1 immunoglobulin heavy chain junction region [Mus musculus]MBK4189304.1 immunoglobulin heavy chain junction region [Mus musculus]